VVLCILLVYIDTASQVNNEMFDRSTLSRLSQFLSSKELSMHEGSC
jgi:hypothetical protein